jgi:GC-rich sequence DNA-binding factor
LIVPETTPLPTLIGTSKRLKAALAEYEVSQIEADNLLAKSEAELSSLTAQETELKTQVESTNTKYEFFLDFKAYINDIASFLEVKYPLLEKMELDNVAFQKERTIGIVGHRRDWDDADDVALFSGVGVNPLFELEKEQQQDKQGEQGDAQMRAEDNEEEVDDMGRSRREDDTEPKSVARRTRRQERAKRRERHLASSSSSHGQAQAQPQASGSNEPANQVPEEEEEGYSTDDTLLQSDSADLITASQTLLESKTSEIFADVSNPEFQDPNQGIKIKFLDWKKKYPQDYKEAFAGLSLVQAWEFWIRVEMCDWNPFGVSVPSRILISCRSLEDDCHCEC